MYWPLLNMYSENIGFGLGGFIISRTFNNRMKGLYLHIYIYVLRMHIYLQIHTHIYIYIYIFLHILYDFSVTPGKLGFPPASSKALRAELRAKSSRLSCQASSSWSSLQWGPTKPARASKVVPFWVVYYNP